LFELSCRYYTNAWLDNSDGGIVLTNKHLAFGQIQTYIYIIKLAVNMYIYIQFNFNSTK